MTKRLISDNTSMVLVPPPPPPPLHFGLVHLPHTPSITPLAPPIIDAAHDGMAFGQPSSWRNNESIVTKNR